MVLQKAGTHFSHSHATVYSSSWTILKPRIRISLQTIDNDVLDGPREKNFFVEIITSGACQVSSHRRLGLSSIRTGSARRSSLRTTTRRTYIGFGQTEYTVTEGTDLKAVFNVRASRGALYGTATAIIRFNTFDDSAISGADFDGVSNQRITFNNSNGSEDVDVNILNDLVIEARSESFIAVLSPSGDLPAGVEFDPNGMTATVTIMDDDKGELRFTRPSFEATVNEMGAGDSTATVSVGVFENFDTTYENFTFVISTMDGTVTMVPKPVQTIRLSQIWRSNMNFG